MVELLNNGRTYHRPDCQHRGKKAVKWEWAQPLTLDEVLAQTEGKSFVDPCRHCVAPLAQVQA